MTLPFLKRSALPPAAIALLTLASASAASASNLQVDPIYLHLKREEPTTVLRITNGGSEPTRYQISAFSWSQDETAEMRLDPTQEILFFPTVFALKAGETRLVRIGTTATFAARERTFRIFVEEFAPEPASPAAGFGLRIRTRVGLPIFLDPPNAVATARIDSVAVSGTQMMVRLRSTGNAHLRLNGVEATGLAAGTGAPVHAQNWGAAYLLVGNDLLFKAPLPREKCGKIHAVKVRVLTEQGPLEQTLDVPAGGCRS